jgi:hypothetical protein
VAAATACVLRASRDSRASGPCAPHFGRYPSPAVAGLQLIPTPQCRQFLLGRPTSYVLG